MLRILQVVNKMDRAGLETVLMNYYRNINRNVIQFDFLTHRPGSGQYDEEILALGGKIYRAPRLYPQNYLLYFKWMNKFWAEHPEYQVVHSHIDAMSYLPLLTAKKANIPVRIAHSHSTGIDKDFKYPLKRLFRRKLKSVTTEEWACGKAAGDFLFCSRKFKIVPNPIDASMYSFSPQKRSQVRKALAVADQTVVIGHVGRFYYPKNQRFLVQIFKKYQDFNSDSKLLFIGEGELENQVREMVKTLGLQSQVVFLGARGDVADIMQGLDILVLPSIFEGVPMVGLEAQAAGLPVLLSNRISPEVAVTESCTFLPLEASEENWALKIDEIVQRKERCVSPDLKQYDVQDAAPKLQKMYQELKP